MKTIATPVVPENTTVVGDGAKTISRARRFLRSWVSGGVGPLLPIATASLASVGCSAALITVGVLDRPEQERMFSAVDRAGLETFAKKPIASKATADGKVVDRYSYVDGEAEVIGLSGERMSEHRVGRAVFSTVCCGFFEVVLVPTAMNERYRATREFQVVYSPDDRVLAICDAVFPVNVPWRDQSLCRLCR